MSKMIAASLMLLIAAMTASAQEQKIAEQPKLDVAKMHDALPDKDYTAKTTDTSSSSRPMASACSGWKSSFQGSRRSRFGRR